MGGARLCAVILVMLLSGSWAMAQGPASQATSQGTPSEVNQPSRFELFGGYSYEHVAPCGNAAGGCGLQSGDLASLPRNFNGWTAAGTYYFSKQFGLTADFAGHYGTQQLPGNIPSSAKFSRYSYMFGPKFAVASDRWEKASPFLHALLGGTHQSVFNTTGFSAALGGGLDYKLSRHMAIRVAQVDYEFITVPKTSTASASSHTNGFRYAGGIVIR